MSKVIVIGGGPAGMMAAAAASQNGHSVLLLERNEKLGKKLYLTGKGRCNLTNASDSTALMAKVNSNPPFLYSAFHAFGSFELMRFFEENGVPLVIERGQRVFPQSGHASDIIKALERYLRHQQVEILLNTEVRALISSGKQRGVQTAKGFLAADAIIIATGGLSYPSTGSTGDGYRFAKALGHSVTKLYPSLVPLIAREDWIPALAGLSLKNIHITATIQGTNGAESVFQDSGEMLFTHNGVSGPVILSASRYLTHHFNASPKIWIDLKPALSPEKLDDRILRDFQENKNKNFINALDALLPQKLIPVAAALTEIDPHRKVNAITREERGRLTSILKGLPITPIDTAGFGEAVITTGGIAVQEVNPSNMASKIAEGVYFAGEVLDLDAMTGGYNLQIAFSTGFLAGNRLN